MIRLVTIHTVVFLNFLANEKYLSLGGERESIVRGCVFLCAGGGTNLLMQLLFYASDLDFWFPSYGFTSMSRNLNLSFEISLG